MSAKHHSFWHWGKFPQCTLCGGFLDGGVDQRLFGPSATAPPEKSQKGNPHRDSGSVKQPNPENKVTGIAQSDNRSPGAWCNVKLIAQQFFLLKDNNWLSNKWKMTSFGSNNFLPGTQQASKLKKCTNYGWLSNPIIQKLTWEIFDY